MNKLAERLRPESVLNGRYTIRRKIGIGGFALVYEAYDEPMDRLVAIKVLHIPDVELHEKKYQDFLDRFEREAKLAAKVHHHCVMEVYDYGISAEEGAPFIVMELLHGHDLELQLERSGAMSPSHFIPLFLGCLDALGCAHREGIVHKDLKPSNIFVRNPGDRTESFCLVDFGVAHMQAEFARRLTQTGNLFATPSYIAPEYAQHQLVTPALDVYQMGLILVEGITGQIVVDSPDFMVCMFQHIQGKLQVPGELLQSPLGPVLRKALALDHRARYQSGFEFADALRALDPDDLPRLNAHAERVPLHGAQLGRSDDAPWAFMTPGLGPAQPWSDGHPTREIDYELELISTPAPAKPNAQRAELETPRPLERTTSPLPPPLAASAASGLKAPASMAPEDASPKLATAPALSDAPQDAAPRRQAPDARRWGVALAASAMLASGVLGWMAPRPQPSTLAAADAPVSARALTDEQTAPDKAAQAPPSPTPEPAAQVELLGSPKTLRVLDGESLLGMTPLTLSVQTWRGRALTFEAPGHQPRVLTMPEHPEATLHVTLEPLPASLTPTTVQADPVKASTVKPRIKPPAQPQAPPKAPPQAPPKEQPEPAAAPKKKPAVLLPQ